MYPLLVITFYTLSQKSQHDHHSSDLKKILNFCTNGIINKCTGSSAIV